MATGDALFMLESESDLKDVDDRRQATTTPKMRFQEWMPSVRIVQIDHIFVTPTVTVKDFKVSRDGGSDHRAISATVKIS
jgi:endonuclease/exonuclease/phosphatase family metal-dependent hydrolase